MRYDAVIEWLSEAIGASCSGVGAEDDRVNKRREAQICDMFERYVSARDGDVVNDYFKVGDGDTLYVYNGICYERIDGMMVRFIVKKVMDRIKVGIVYRKNSQGKIAQECIESLCCNEDCLFEPDRRYAVFRNAILDTATGAVHGHGMNYKTDLVLDFDYDPKAKSALWDGLVVQTIPDMGMRTAFQTFCGAFLADRSKYNIDYMCLLVGGGRNGKSVVAKAITGMFGDKLVSCYSPEQLFKSSQSLYHLADVSGKLANYCDDVSNKDFSGGDFKEFVSGAPFQARHPYGRPFKVTKIPLMICCVNEIPPTTDDSLGYFRRLLPIMCPNQVSEEDADRTLPDKLNASEVRSAIFNWVYEGYKMFLKNNGEITISESIKQMRNEIVEDSNSARRWIKERGLVKVEPNGELDSRWNSMKDWMADYIAYCKEYAEMPKSPKSVGRIFKELGFASRKKGDTTWYCMGRSLSAMGVTEVGGGMPYREVSDVDLPF